MNSEDLRIETQLLTPTTGSNSPPRQKPNDPCLVELPPAYTPTNRSSILNNIAAYLAHQPVAAQDVNAQIRRVVPYPQIAISTDLPDEDNDALSPISLNISTRINVSSDGNLIALPCSPSDQAKSIAKAVIEAFQGQDWATGLPMIDESGRPRPLKLEVDSGMTIEGSSNVIGTEFIISEVLRQRRQSEEPTQLPPSQPNESFAVTSSSTKRRRRASDLDDSIEPTRIKRARSEA